MDDVQTVEFGCCFCSAAIKRDDGIYGVALFHEEAEQTWYCHLNCFLAHLAPGYGEDLHPHFAEQRRPH